MVKKVSVCKYHQCREVVRVCQHVKQSVVEGAPLSIVPLVYERFLLEKFHERFWLCQSCAKQWSLPPEGVYIYDPEMRAIHSEEISGSSEGSSTSSYEYDIDSDPFHEFRKTATGLCKDCFYSAYPGVQSRLGEIEFVAKKVRVPYE